MTKEELKQIYHINREIIMWQKELDRLECKSLVKGQEITDMPFGGGTSDKVGDLAIEKVDIEAVIKGLLAKIQIERRKAIGYIETIDDSVLRQVMFLRCVSHMTWNEVGDSLGITENCAKQMYSRHFKNNIEKAS